MSVAEKLTTIAENVAKVFEAGKVAGGGGSVVPVEEKDVNFYDYDGTLLYSYTIAEAQVLTELPPLPSHEGLICQGWNWELEQVTALHFPMDIGALYTTDDGWSRFYIDVPKEITIELCCRTTTPNLVTYDWGDGSAQESPISRGSYCSKSHTYAPGKYVIRVFNGGGAFTLGRTDNVSIFNTGYSPASNMLYKAEIADGVGLWAAFNGCARLSSVSLPLNTILNNGEFGLCSNLKAVILPPSVTWLANKCFNTSRVAMVSLSSKLESIGTYGFRYAGSRRSIGLPEGLKTIGNNALEEGRSYTAITIPTTVESIGTSALAHCSGLFLLRFLPTTPPTVANANAFTGIPTTCVVEVPAESLEAYQTATNYASLAAQMVGV